MSDLRQVRDFKVIRKGVGAICWIKPVDLCRVNLDEHVVIEKGYASVYETLEKGSGREDEKPRVGQGLNQPSVVTLEEIRPKNHWSEAKRLAWPDKVKAKTEGMGATFRKYDMDSGVWEFQTEHKGARDYWEHISAESGATVGVQLCDVSMKLEATSVVECSTLETIGMLHSAGVLADALLANQTQAGIQRVWGPKAHAAWSLHQASSESQLQTFILFSSIAALFGGAGQANYAAANACLDGLVRLRHEHGQAVFAS